MKLPLARFFPRPPKGRTSSRDAALSKNRFAAVLRFAAALSGSPARRPPLSVPRQPQGMVPEATNDKETVKWHRHLDM